MKYLKKFNFHDEYVADYENILNPSVSLCYYNKHIHFKKQIPYDYSQDYLTFVALEDGRFSFSGSSGNNYITYSIDNGETWVDLSRSTNSPIVKAGDTILWKGQLTPYDGAWDYYGIGKFRSTGNFEVAGNVMSLLYGDDFRGQTSFGNKDAAFLGLFNSCTKLTDAGSLYLPGIELKNRCYSSMFSGCTSLTVIPELSATTLAEYCYESMFAGCTSLTTPPELPATTLAEGCYYNMFSGCASLTETPKLSVTTLADYCYNSMFRNCTSLTVPPVLPATTLADFCYSSMFNGCTSLTTVPELPATTLGRYCYSNMFNGCTALTTIPSDLLPATEVNDGSYANMFNGCINLITTPELPATTLSNSCYQYMFWNCSSLTTTPELPATTLFDSCYCYMLGNTNLLPDCTNINFSSGDVARSGGLCGLFAYTKVTDEFLESVLPKNNQNRICLPVTSLNTSGSAFAPGHVYANMFKGCTGITISPELPATSVCDSCYSSMFQNCTNLVTGPSELPATNLYYHCYSDMFNGCTKLVTVPSILPATSFATHQQNCYVRMFANCTSMTRSPDFPAFSEPNYYSYKFAEEMFSGCTSLNYIKGMMLAAPSSQHMLNWVAGVSPTGTFVKNSAATWTNTFGPSEIPTGWNVEIASA